MATTKIEVNTAAITGAGSTFANADLANISIGGTAIDHASIGATTIDGGTAVNIPGYGKLTASSTTKLTFTASTALAAGDFTFVNSAAAKWDVVDLTLATNSIVAAASDATTKLLGGAGADSLTGTAATTTITGGAGNDTLTAGGVSASLTGGTGADLFVQTDATDMFTLTASDYYYGQNDVVALGGTHADALGALDGTGAFTGAAGLGLAAVTVKDTVAANEAYKIKVADKSGNTLTGSTKEYWTAKTGSTAITMDGSAATSALEINTNTATNAVVTGSAKNDNITLTSSQVTLNAGVNAGLDLITGFDAGFTGDVLNLNGYTLNDVVWGNVGAATKIGTTTTLDGATVFHVANAQELRVQENGGEIKKVIITNTAGNALDASKNADVYISTGAANVSLDASKVITEGTVINFQDTDKYRNLTGMTGFANATGYYIGNSTTATNIDLSGSAKASEVWGGNAKADNISLMGANAAQDIVYYGSTDGMDVVKTGFKAGFGATADMVNLYDVADVSKLTYGVGSLANGVKVAINTSNTLDLTTADAFGTTNSVQLKLKDSSGTVKKVAAAVNAVTGSTMDGTDADLVIGQDKLGGTDVVKYASSTGDLVVNLLDTSVYKNIEDVDLTGSTGSTKWVIGSALSASNITLAGATTEVWGGSKDADKITVGSGTDTIWYGTNDGGDSVTGFTAGTDKVHFYDKSVAAVAAGYTWTGTTFASTTKTADVLTLGAAQVGKTVDILDKDNKAAKVALANAGNALTYVKGTDIYMGAAGAALNVTGSENVALYLGNGVDATVNDIYFSGVTTIDANTATGETVLIGSATGKDVLTAGKTTSAMWGGGSAADEMVGGVGTDQYWFGAGDGADKVNGGVDKKDTVVLYNATSVADVTMTVDANAGKFVITAKDGSALTVDNGLGTNVVTGALDGGLTFQFGVNEAAKSYTYDRIAKAFVAK